MYAIVTRCKSWSLPTTPRSSVQPCPKKASGFNSAMVVQCANHCEWTHMENMKTTNVEKLLLLRQSCDPQFRSSSISKRMWSWSFHMSDLQMIVFDSTVVDSKKFLEGLEATGFAAARLGDARTCGQQLNTKNSRVFSENGEKWWNCFLKKCVRFWEALDLICVPPRLYDWEFCLETPIAHRRSEPKAGVC